jgi:hypothetical protein
MRLRVLLLLLVVVAGLPGRGIAQVGASTDILTGVVTGEDGQPLPDVTVEAYSLETQVTRRARTDARGRFTILFPDGGGQYRMTARAIGMTPRIEVVQRHADEDRLVWNPRLSGGVVRLDAIDVRAGAAMIRAPDGPTPGSTERGFGEAQLSRLPVDANDLAALAGLVPGVLTFGATDSTATAFSVAGLGTDANALTLDGLLFGSQTLPQEGLRQTRVVTSTYDVSRGQFSGGLIASTTRSGSNVIQGSSQYQLRDDDLAVSADDASAYAQAFTQHVISGGLGGPLVRDRLFLFGSLQARFRSDPQQTLLSATEPDYIRLGVSPDSVERFYAIVDSLGVPPTSTPNEATRSDDNLSGLARLDWVLSNSHTVTLRGDWRGTAQDPTRLGALALPQTGGTLESGGGGVMATLTSRFGATMLNEARAYWQTSRRDGVPFTPIPQGRVQVASDLPDSTRSVVTLLFGGNTGLPTQGDSRSLELTDEVSWMPGVGTHRLKIGATWLAESSEDLQGSNQFGTFSYNSLAELERGIAASYRRTLAPVTRDSRSYRWGVYAGDVWMAGRGFQLTYGGRLEGSNFGAPPPYNPVVDSVFGRRTDRLPTEVHLSPRAGFSWTLGGSTFERGRPGTPPTTVIRGGIGEFRSQPPTGLVAQARTSTGLDTAFAELVCTGLAVPDPQWDAYYPSGDGIPTQCRGDLPLPGNSGPARTVLLLEEGFQASRAWRASLGFERRLTQLFRATLELSVARGVAQQGFYDLNLASTPRFALASEGDRPVYVAPIEISPLGGVPRFLASRTDSTFGQVLEARSNLGLQSEQVTVGIGGLVGRGIALQGSYTWLHSRDERTGIRSGSTAGDPNEAEWARSENERRHSVLATITYPVSQSLEVTAIGRATSGAPYTPLVGGDVNGDGSRNDRAFIFAPGTGEEVAEGMDRLLATGPSAVRECLSQQIGVVAGRSTCTGPWQYTLDLQLNWRPATWGLNRRLTVSVVTVNLLRGLDELFHGVDGAKGWGLMARPDNTLLYVTGFDPVAQRYAYEVNERFGATAGTAQASRPPFQIGIQMRITIGPDRMQQALDAMRAGGGRPGAGGGMGMGAGVQTGGFMGPAFSPTELIARIEAALPNPAGQVLALRDSLGLDSAQVALLVPVRDSLAARNASRVDSLRAAMQGLGDNVTPAQMQGVLPRLRPMFEAARTDIQQVVVTVRAVLTPAQWELVPAAIKNAQVQPFRPGGGPGGQRPPGGPQRP